MNETLVLNRDDAVRAIQDMLRMLGPQIKVEIQQSGNAVTLRAQSNESELMQWAERIGTRYQNVFERLANS